MPTTHEIEIAIIAIDSASNILGGIAGSFRGLFDSIISGVASAANALGDIIAPVIDFGKESILTAARVEELQAVNQILAKNAGISGQTVIDVAESIRGMGIEAGIAEEAVANFVRSNLDLSHAAELARVAQDAAVIAGQNSSDTFDRIVYGIETLNPLILRNAGITVDLQLAYKAWAEQNDRTVESLTTAEKQQIAMNSVLQEGSNIAGAYAAAMEEPAKQIRSWPRLIDDIRVAVGGPFQDAFGQVIDTISGFLKQLGPMFEEGGKLRPFIDSLAAGAQSLIDVIIGFTHGDFGPFTEFINMMRDDLIPVINQRLPEIIRLFEKLKATIGPELSVLFRQALGWLVDNQDSIVGAIDRMLRMFEAMLVVINNISKIITPIFVALVDISGKVSTILLDIFNKDWVKLGHDIANSFINAVKTMLGISSPSTVFAEIGRELVLGLTLGWSGAFTNFLATIAVGVKEILKLFEPVANLLGIDLGGTTGGSTGTVGGRPMGGTVGGGSILTGPSTQTVNNYYYGPVYFGAAGEPGAYYDCPSPNPLITATATGGTGGSVMLR